MDDHIREMNKQFDRDRDRERAQQRDAWDEPSELEVCVSCGTYFHFRGGNQQCWKCRKQ